VNPSDFQISIIRRIKNRLVILLLIALACVALIPLIHVLHYVYAQGLPHWNLSFFTELPRPVGESGGGLGNAVVGSFFLVLVAAIVGVPVGILVGIFLSEYSRSALASWVRTSIELPSVVPSIVLGIFAYSALVVPIGHFSMLAGSFALAVILLPVVAKTTEEVLKLIPSHIREAGLALGIPRWKVTLRIVLIAARSGITTGVALALARVAGETAPLLFTALSSQHWPRSLLEPAASLPVQIYSFALAPFEEWNHLAWAAASVLVSLTLVTNLIMKWATRSRGENR